MIYCKKKAKKKTNKKQQQQKNAPSIMTVSPHRATHSNSIPTLQQILNVIILDFKTNLVIFLIPGEELDVNRTIREAHLRAGCTVNLIRACWTPSGISTKCCIILEQCSHLRNSLDKLHLSISQCLAMQKLELSLQSFYTIIKFTTP